MQNPSLHSDPDASQLFGMPDTFHKKTQKPSRAHTSDRRDLLRDYFEARERAGAERGYNRDIGCVAPARHQDTADAGPVVPGIRCVPTTAEIDFEPAAEIHRSVVERHADVSEIAGAVTRRNVHAAAERDGEVGKITAHAASFGIAALLGPRRLNNEDMALGCTRELLKITGETQ